MPSIRAEVRIRPAPTNILQCTDRRVTAGTKTYEFDAIHRTTTQRELFECSVKPLIDLFVQGYDCSVIAYGQTGSGKTHTIGISPKSNDAMVQRTLEYLFNSGHRLACSLIEIYNEEIIDLLAGERVALQLRASSGAACIVGLTEHPLDTLEMALNVLKCGCSNRTTKSTRMNSESSRSHAIYTLRLVETGASLSFVDLAGSERLKRTQCSGLTARESISINTGLLALGNVISALYSKKKYIPFRDSKLTRILEPCLSSHLLFVACISPLHVDLNETSNTLKYAGRAAKISVDAKVRISEDKGRAEVMRLEREVSGLREENNRLRSMLNSRNKSGIGEVKNHPFVKQLLKEIEELKRQAHEKKYKSGEKEEEINIEPDSKIKDAKRKICATEGKSENRSENTQTEAFKTEKEGHRRVVSFDLDPRPKRSNLFTPRKETMRMFPRLYTTFPVITQALGTLGGEVVASTADGGVFSFVERQTLLFEEKGITLFAESPALGLFYSTGSLLKFFTKTTTPMPIHACNTPITALAVNNNIVFIGHSDGTLSLFDLISNTPVFTEKIHSGAIFGISLINSFLFTGSRDHSIRYSELAGGNCNSSPVIRVERDVALAPPHYDAVTCLLNYKNVLVSLSRDCSIKTWNRTGPHKTVAGAHSDWIKTGAVLQDCWATGSKDGEVRCWDLVDGSVRCIGKVQVGQPVERMVAVADSIWVGTRKELKAYAI